MPMTKVPKVEPVAMKIEVVMLGVSDVVVGYYTCCFD